MHTVNNAKVIVVHYGNVMLYPPVINLLENLIANNRDVVLISGNTDRLPIRILSSGRITINKMPMSGSTSPLGRMKRRMLIGRAYREALESSFKMGDIVWTTTDSTVRALNTALKGKKHILQLMELEESFPLFSGAKLLKFELDEYARNAWKVVVPERNRAYIQQIMWHLDRVPQVLPNKPYSLDPGTPDEVTGALLEELEREKKKNSDVSWRDERRQRSCPIRRGCGDDGG